MLASAIIAGVRRVTNDAIEDYRTSDAEMLAWIGEGQRRVCVVHPEQSTTRSSLSLADGARQNLPAGAIALLDIPRNTSGTAIRRTSRALLDAFLPNWYGATASSTIENFIYDAEEPTVFHVYPPAQAGTQVDAIYSTLPADPATADTALTVQDQYADVIQNYVLFRLYSKDTEDAAAAQVAAAYLQLFTAQVGA